MSKKLELAQQSFTCLVDENPIPRLTDYYFDGWSVIAEIELRSSHRTWVKFTLINRKTCYDPLHSALKCWGDIKRVCDSVQFMCCED